MNSSRNQHTIADSCEVSGCGYWTGRKVHVVMSPASAGTGVRLVRSDLPGRPECVATSTNRHDAQLRTVISDGAARFEMIEHLMAALYALEIDNCIVEIDGEELPGLDGSSKAFVDVLQHAGLIVQAMQRPRFVIDQVIRIESDDRWIQASPPTAALPKSKKPHADGCSFEYQLYFDNESAIGSQSYRMNCTPANFIREVATARTFVTESQANTLRAQGVAGHVTNQDLLVFGDDGPIDNPLRFSNECARHKTLDMIGDLALTGFDLVGNIVSYRGGHNMNGKLTQKLVELASSHTADREKTNRRVA